MVAALAALLLVWARRAVNNVVPFLDGSDHISIVANLLAGLRGEGPRMLVDFGLQDMLLAWLAMAVPTAVVGPGRIAFAMGWIACFFIMLVAMWRLLVEASAGTRSLAIALLLFTGLLQSQQGGAWDTRIDLFSIMLVFAALVAVVRSAGLVAAWLGVLACFAKAAAVALVVPALVAGIAFGYVRPRRRLGPLTLLQVACLLAVALLFGTHVGPHALAYNLIATGVEDPSERLGVFIGRLTSAGIPDGLFYLRSLAFEYRTWALLPAALLVPIVWLRDWPRGMLRDGSYALVVLAITLAALTVSPLHASVLTVWFIPALGLVAGWLARLVRAGLSSPLTWAAACVLAIAALAAVPTARAPADERLERGVKDVIGQANQLAVNLGPRLESGPPNARVVLLANFFTRESPLEHNVQAYRALLWERLRANVSIYTFELGVRHPNLWWEMRDYAVSFAYGVLILQENPVALPAAHPAQDAGVDVWQQLTAFRGAHPECLEEMARPIELPPMGRREVWLLADDAPCRTLVFGAAN
jgi:hypothetical protein